jgi:hypothetical protein
MSELQARQSYVDGKQFSSKKPRVVRGASLVQTSVDTAQCASTASSNSATMLVILIIGFTAGPAVSL